MPFFVSGLECLIAILIVALMPVAPVFISRHYALREKQLSLRCEGEGRRLEELLESKRLLEARLEAPETIVCGVEFDLDQRLQRLGRTAPARRALPGSGLGRGAPGATAHESPWAAGRAAARLDTVAGGRYIRAPMSRVLLAFKCFFLVLFSRRLPPEAVELLPPPDPDGSGRIDGGEARGPAALPARAEAADEGAPRPIERSKAAHQKTTPVSPADPLPGPDAATSEKRGAILLLGLLQREGRLLDFLQEEVDGYSDAQIGAAVRDIHRGCRKVLAEHVKIEPVMGEPDNATVRIDNGFDPSRIRLVGNVAGAPPFVGTLRHPGWRGSEVKLPELPKSHDPSVIAPAEVEV